MNLDGRNSRLWTIMFLTFVFIYCKSSRISQGKIVICLNKWQTNHHESLKFLKFFETFLKLFCVSILQIFICKYLKENSKKMNSCWNNKSYQWEIYWHSLLINIRLSVFPALDAEKNADRCYFYSSFFHCFFRYKKKINRNTLQSRRPGTLVNVYITNISWLSQFPLAENLAQGMSLFWCQQLSSLLLLCQIGMYLVLS